jgi:anti-sigma B factor antagonist
MDEEIASFRRIDRPGAPCLVVAGEIDLLVVDRFNAALTELIGDAQSPAVLDLTAVTFFNSTGIGALVAANALAEERGVQLTIEPSESVRRVLEVIGMADSFDLRERDG